MTTNADLLDSPWQAKLHVERVPHGWAIRADAWLADDAVVDVYDHEWWLGLTAGGTTRWHASSAARSENGLADDAPSVGALWGTATGPIEVGVELWIALRDEHGNGVETAYRARAVVSEPGWHVVALGAVPGWTRPATAAVIALAPDECLALPNEPGSHAAIVPELGLLEAARDGWALVGPGGRTPLPGFVPTRSSALEAITTSPDGRVAVVWRIDQRWHIALYQLPAPTPRAMIAPTPPENGNTPHPGRFLPGDLALLPVGFDEIGLIDTARGAIRHRLGAGGYVRDVGLDGDATGVWIAGHGHARCFDPVTGSVREDHRIPEAYGRATAFDARDRRAYAYDVFAYDGDALSGLTWYALDGATGQLVLPDALDGALVTVPGGVVAHGGAGLWFVDVERGRLVRLTGPLNFSSYATYPFAAMRDGDRLVVWTQDPAHVRVAYTLPAAT